MASEYALDMEEIGVADGEGESWDELAKRLREERQRWFDCPCGAQYRNRRAAIQCCEQYFGDVDLPSITEDGATDDDVRDALTEN